MKKLYAGIIFAVFALSSFMALNMYTSTSFPGYGGNLACNYCHNQPALVKNVDASFAMNNHTAQMNVFTEKNGQWATDEVPTIPTNNRSAPIEFVSMTFVKNSTDIMVRAQVSDSTFNNLTSSTSDKFGIIFDIDVANFSVGDFLTNYNSSDTNLDTILSGQMAFKSGHADFWYVDMANTPVNTSSMAQDKYIDSTGISSDGAAHQDVHVAVWYGGFGHAGRMEYDFIFVRALKTNDPNDAQFNVDGTAVRYAIAHWDNEAATYHLSSFDQAIVVGNNLNVIQTKTTSVLQTTTVTETKSVSTTTGTTSSFTVVFVLAALVVSIPVISHMRKRKE